MSDYELTFLVDPATLSDDVIDQLYDQYDCLAGGRPHGGAAFVTLTVPAPDAMSAVRSGWGVLHGLGLCVLDLDRDLVDVAEIARRTNTTRQTVHNWIKGARRGNFPRRFTDAGNGLWLWGEVHAWALDQGVAVEDPAMSYPGRDDHDEASTLVRNGWDSPHRAPRRERPSRRPGWAGVDLAERLFEQQSSGPIKIFLTAETDFRHEYTATVRRVLRDRSARQQRDVHA